MQSNYQILLSSDIWSDFTNRLTHVSYESNSGIDAFWAAVSHDISIHREGDNVIVRSSNIDESSIIAALTQSTQRNSSNDTVGSSQIQSSYQIRISNSIDMTAFTYEANKTADDDSYQVHPNTPLKNSFKFHSPDTQYYLKSA